MADQTKTGAELIAEERVRQVSKEGYDSGHDDQHHNGELAMAAVCYASTKPVYVEEYRWGGYCFVDPWPWPDDGDKRLWDGCKHPKGSSSYERDERISLLVKAGALLAAEIDRLQREARRA